MKALFGAPCSVKRNADDDAQYDKHDDRGDGFHGYIFRV